MLTSTRKYEVVNIIYNDGSFAIASGYWDGNENLTLACRWHEKEGIGYPQTFGKAQWMLLPDNIKVDIQNALDPKNSKVCLTFG